MPVAPLGKEKIRLWRDIERQSKWARSKMKFIYFKTQYHGGIMKLTKLRILVCMALVMLLVAPQAFAKDKNYGGMVTISVLQTDAHVRNFNPLNVETGRYQSQDWIYERLYIFNVSDPSNDFPWLATKYEIADDVKSVTFTLRQGVKWSDGQAFDADDVIFTANLKKKHPELPEYPTLWGETGFCDSIEKLGKYKVRFNYKNINSIAHYAISTMYILPEHIWSNVKDPLHFTNEKPVGTGPFTNVLTFKKTIFELGKNANYWQKGKPYVDGIRCPQYSSNEQILAAAVKGELDWFSDFLTNPAKELTAKNPEVKHFFPADTLVSLQFNTTKAPFNDLEFRKAVSIAVNRQDLIDIATFGITSPAVYPAGIGPFYAAWIDEKRLEPYKYILKYDPAKAKAILDKAGYVDKDGDGFRDNKDGSELVFKISVPTGWDDWINSVQIMTENLQDIGVNAKMHTPDEGAWFEKIATGEFDVYMMWNNGHASPWEAFDDLYEPSKMVKGAITEQAMHQMKIPEINKLMKAFTMTKDVNVQKDLAGQIEEIHCELLPTVPLFAGAAFFEYSSAKFEGWANEDNPYIRPMVWQGTQERAVHVLGLSLKDGIK